MLKIATLKKKEKKKEKKYAGFQLGEDTWKICVEFDFAADV